jgi:hypothetical protein
MNSNEEVKPPSSGTEEVSLLSHDAIARLKAPILEAEERKCEAVERRERKYTNAKQLKDAVRREELRQIPKADRTPEEQREFSRLEARRHRANAKGNDADSLSNVETAEEFWSANRLLANGQKIHAWREQEQRVLDQIYWLNVGWRTSPQDPNFVGLNEGLADLDDFIDEFGLVHDDEYKNPILQNVRPLWSVWADKPDDVPFVGTIMGFWRNPEIFNALLKESEPTAIYARYGIRTALPAYHVRLFKQRITEHLRSDLIDGRKAHAKYEGEKCWFCNFERLHATENGGNTKP